MKIGLQIQASLENVTKLKPHGDDFRWYVKLKCLGCGETTMTFQYLTLDESQPLKGGRGSASLVIKCKMCSRQNSIDILKDSCQSYNTEDVGKYKTIMVFDCRGIEPVEFSPRVGFGVDGLSGYHFHNVDLTEGDWVDYDDKANEPVRVCDILHQFVKVK